MTDEKTSEPSAQGLLRGAGWDAEVYIEGWVRGGDGTIPVLDKATSEPLANLGQVSRKQLDDAVTAATEAQRAWAAGSGTSRAEILGRAARLIDTHRDEYIEWLVREAGSSYPKAASEIRSAIDELENAAELATEDHTDQLRATGDETSEALRVPYGVVGVITPWNVPLVLAMRSVAPALALGNAVVLKPDNQTAISGGILIARLFEEAGLPPGLFSVVAGGGPTIGAALVAHPGVDMISFTGSTKTGREIAVLAAPSLKKIALELGGKNPHVVLGDADVEGAAASGAWGTFLHQGQICMAAGRHIVDASISDQYTDQLAARAASLRFGDPFREEVDLGPLINLAQATRVEEIIEDARRSGATVVTGGRRTGSFVEPTVLAGVVPGMRAYDEEIFGPVAVIITARDDADAIRIANDTEYGLSASVHSGSVDRANSVADHIRSGMVHINGQPINDNPWSPMGGVRASGNGGRFGGAANVDMFTTWRWRTIRQSADRGHFAEPTPGNTILQEP